jgi:hypothetical protein
MASVLERVVPDCHDFAFTVEALLARRRRDSAQRLHTQTSYADQESWTKEWTRDEVCDLVYSSYKAMLKGAIRRPPRRHVVMDLADYLECSLDERNRLLVAARYAPEQPYLQGAALATALAYAGMVIDDLPFPAHALTRDWDLHLPNDPLVQILRMTREQFTMVPAEQRNILHLVFDPASPLYALLRPNRASWERTARREVHGFKQQNQLCQYDAWSIERVERWMSLPHFARFWHEAELGAMDASIDHDVFSPYEFELTYDRNAVLHMRAVLIALSDCDYPKVIAYLPADRATRHHFTALGLSRPVTYREG